MHVPVGETLRTVCPFCGGGRTKESSFVATNTGAQIKYICHRASCGKAGTWDSASGMSTIAPGIKVPKPWPYVFPAVPSEMASLAAKYNLSVEDIQRLRPMRCTYSKGEIRWWYPVFGPHGSEHGGIGRSFTHTPKSLTHIEEGYKLGSWYHNDGADTVVLVEDQVSAARMAKHVTSVALLGCHLNDTLLQFLAKHTKHLKIALDYDALDKAVKMAAQVSPLFQSVAVWSLPIDIKNMDEETLCDYVRTRI